MSDLTADERDALAEPAPVSNVFTRALDSLAEFDPVNRPAHYNQGAVECIDAMVAAFGPDAVSVYCRIAAFKYLWRADLKDTLEQDTRKAIWYLRFSINDDPRDD